MTDCILSVVSICEGGRLNLEVKKKHSEKNEQQQHIYATVKASTLKNIRLPSNTAS